MTLQDNQKLRALLSLPPIQPSASTSLVVPEMPPQEIVTGHLEVDAVLWLQKVVATGNQALIDKALEAAKRIKTPMQDLGKRYADHIARKTGNIFGAALSSFGFGELEDQAERAIERAARRHEAMSRFGSEDALFAELPTEKACKTALRGLKKKDWPYYEESAAAERFAKREALRPHTLDDCLYAMQYWEALYRLRHAWQNAGDHCRQVYAYEDYCFGLMAHIRARNSQEAMRAFDFIKGEDGGISDRTGTPDILRNLVECGWSESPRRGFACSIIEADFEKSIVTLEMKGKFQVSAGPKVLCDAGENSHE